MKIRAKNLTGALCPQKKLGLTLRRDNTFAGFILLEVLVSVIILTVGLLAVLGAFSTSSKIITTSERYQVALQLAEQKMYEIQTTPDYQLRDYAHGGFGDKYSDYSWDYEIDEEQSEFYGDEGGFVLEPGTYKKITLTITFRERGKEQTPITLVTYQTSRLRYIL